MPVLLCWSIVLLLFLIISHKYLWNVYCVQEVLHIFSEMKIKKCRIGWSEYIRFFTFPSHKECTNFIIFHILTYTYFKKMKSIQENKMSPMAIYFVVCITEYWFNFEVTNLQAAHTNNMISIKEFNQNICQESDRPSVRNSDRLSVRCVPEVLMWKTRMYMSKSPIATG